MCREFKVVINVSYPPFGQKHICKKGVLSVCFASVCSNTSEHCFAFASLNTFFFPSSHYRPSLSLLNLSRIFKKDFMCAYLKVWRNRTAVKIFVLILFSLNLHLLVCVHIPLCFSPGREPRDFLFVPRVKGKA